MSQGCVDLNRRFTQCDAEFPDVDLLSSTAIYGGELGWKTLLLSRRVVLLAEAGSGKTTEFEQQESHLRAAGNYCFLTTCRKIGKDGLEGALKVRYMDQFTKWRDSGEQAWLFLDSFDEAKRADFRMSEVLDEVASAIYGVEGRIHIILSGRYSDWEFKRDFRSLLERIPLPSPQDLAEEQNPNDTLIAALNNKKPPEPKEAEPPLVVVMSSLDKERVERFAAAKGVTQVEEFLGEVEQKNLWQLARRPMDLDWLVKHWHREKALGNWEAMLRTSIKEYLAEPNPHLSRTDCLDPERSMLALDRIGAALVMGRFGTILIPEGDVDLTDEVEALDLAAVLPDWQPSELQLLLARPIFQAAAAGYVKLTNDNQGEVRGFLAACWLRRLRTDHNCPWSRLENLLFADTYGEALVRPSMRSTAAWLSLWDDDVCKEVLGREPLLLMDAGDPGSLPLTIRVRVTEAVMKRLTEDDSGHLPDRNALMRVSRQDMVPSIEQLWSDNEHNAASSAVRDLLVLMVWLGRLRDCAELVLAATLSGCFSSNSLIYAGRALATAGNVDHKRQHIEYILDHLEDMRPSVIWDTLDIFFPDHLTVDEFLGCLKCMRLKSLEDRSHFEYYGSRLLPRVQSKDAALRVLRKLLSFLSDPDPLPDLDNLDPQETLLDTIGIATARVLTLSSNQEAPVEAIDCALRLGYLQKFAGHSVNTRDSVQELWNLLEASPDRRRTTLWHSAMRLREAQPDWEFRHPQEMRTFGYCLNLAVEDLRWLLTDLIAKPDDFDIELATNAAMDIWAQNSKDPELLARIKEAASPSPVGLRVVNSRLNPPPPSAEWQQLERRRLERREDHALKIAERDKSWIELAEKLRSAPNILKENIQQTADGVGTPLYNLWWLLQFRHSQSLSRSAIRDLSPLRPMFGDDVVNALQGAFIEYWRVRRPVSISKRKPEDRRTIYHMDLIGLVGVTQEAEVDAAWAKKLSRQEVEWAAIYATFEVNGFPPWLNDLATSHPDVIGSELWDYIRSDLSADDSEPLPPALVHLDHANAALVATFEDRLVDWLVSKPEAPSGLAERVLEILSRSPSARKIVARFARDRFVATDDHSTQASYFVALCAEDPDEAVSVLEDMLDGIEDNSRRRAVAQACLAASYGSRHSRRTLEPSSLPPDILRRLAILAFRYVHPEDDNRRPSGVVYSPDQRDQAQEARYTLFKAFADTPGLATCQTLRELRQGGDFPMSEEQIRRFERIRIEHDSELERWLPEHICDFERDFKSVPSTSQSLQQVVLVTLGEIQHHLLHGDFNQGKVVVGLKDEIAVQNWFANELQTRQGRSFTVERGAIVADEKEPDIRLSSRDGNARCPIEIKIAENWSLRELELALQDQLASRYLRVRDNRFGILLLVHQKSRKRGWKCGNRYLSLSKVIAHLQELATEIGASGSLAPQASVFAVNLSGIQLS